MRINNWLKTAVFVFALVPPAAINAAGGKVLPVIGKERLPETKENKVRYPCLTPSTDGTIDFGLTRKDKWSLPDKALAAEFLDTINILVLRYNFQFETIDNPNTTGHGRMDLSTPLSNPIDSAEYYNAIGHLVDPPPHDSVYFDAQLKALQKYYETISEGKITLAWDIFPPAKDSNYILPQSMSYYGKCDFDSVVIGLENYFIDCINLADSVSPEIDFSKYESIFLFHAGSDRQNDIGFPPTCNDLFTGFIVFGDSISVDGDSSFVRSALLLPETASQDNRGTALNAVIAHEFGHQLGLVDLYSTATFLSQLGDFALMDNNGFGTGIDFGFDVGQVFGAIPLFPSAWSRAHLGFVDVVDFRQDSDLRLVAAEVVSTGIKIARIPISENEYYLLENRIVETDGKVTALLADSATSVFLWPVDLQRNFTGEYDFLMPGSGLLIYLVDEGVAGLDYDNDGINNFDDNDLQWDPDRKFITLIEADGIINFGGYYRAGFGRPEDMYRDDRNTSFTPNTNPPSIDNSGNNTRVRLTNISRDTTTAVQGLVFLDSVITANMEIDGKAAGFPVRAGYPAFGLNPIADDIDKDGTPELIFASGTFLNVATLDGQNFWKQFSGCTSCPAHIDTAYSSISTGDAHSLPVFAPSFGDTIMTSPVTGVFPSDDTLKYIAFGTEGGVYIGLVWVYSLLDLNNDDIPDARSFPTIGRPIALAFENQVWALTSEGTIYRKTAFVGGDSPIGSYKNDEYHGIVLINNSLLLLAGNDTNTKLYLINGPANVDSISLGGYYTLGPVVADMNLDGLPELVTFSSDGDGLLLTIDTAANPPTFITLSRKSLGYEFTTNPIIGDVDLDGYPDIIIGGKNFVYAFDDSLNLKLDFPIEASDKYINDDIIAAPITADIETGELPEIIFPSLTGNMYSFGSRSSYGFPLSAGEVSAGSPVYTSDGTTGKLGYLGADGWFYLWDVAHDNSKNFWPMGGHDPAGTYVFNENSLPSTPPLSSTFDKSRFFNFPNPVTEGSTTIQYYLGEDAQSVLLKVFDLSGREVFTTSGTTGGQRDNRVTWNCADITPGVYRCIIEVNFNGPTETAFTDIAVIR